MPGGVVRYVPLHPPKDGATKNSSAADWTVDMAELERTISLKTRMIVSDGDGILLGHYHADIRHRYSTRRKSNQHIIPLQRIFTPAQS